MSRKNFNIKIIAEIAQGFEGNLDQSKLLIKAAAKSGADSIKFQMVFADELATKDYQYFKLFHSLEMDKNKWEYLKKYSDKLGIDFLVDVFGTKSLNIAEDIGIKTIKIHGTDITNIGLLEAISNSSIKNVILGVGGSLWSEISVAINILQKKSLTILCGFQGYPTRAEDNQINRMRVIKKKVSKIHSNFKMGFADHPNEEEFFSTFGLTAIGAGATVIEKHLTIAKVMELEDFESALNPDEFSKFVSQIRIGEKALGSLVDSEDFDMSSAEGEYREKVRRDVVAFKNIKKGERLSSKNIALKRTSEKNTIKQIELVYGKTVNTSIKKNKPILKSNLE